MLAGSAPDTTEAHVRRLGRRPRDVRACSHRGDCEDPFYSRRLTGGPSPSDVSLIDVSVMAVSETDSCDQHSQMISTVRCFRKVERRPETTHNYPAESCCTGSHRRSRQSIGVRDLRIVLHYCRNFIS
jgi:hypothetical protein